MWQMRDRLAKDLCGQTIVIEAYRMGECAHEKRKERRYARERVRERKILFRKLLKNCLEIHFDLATCQLKIFTIYVYAYIYLFLFVVIEFPVY